ncbi:MAG: SAM-dependent chlorinase/fluorinase [Bacteroidetes bacterium]|nr:SAM-dependent chlorinase/fluorinase [Bacteroidota bacterium]
MSLISLTTDFGSDSHYVAALKAHILQLLPTAIILDISHNITSHNILQAAFVIKNSYKNFPVGSVHLIAVDSNIDKYKKYLVVEHSGQYFITSNNGIIDLLFDEAPNAIWQIKGEAIQENDLFPEKNTWAKVATSIILRKDIELLLQPCKTYHKIQSLKSVVSDDKIIASVIFIDSYQNAFLNVSKSEFEKASKSRNFKLYYTARHPITIVSKIYNDVAEGEELMLFNENDYLEIAINKGKASSLLGLKLGNQIIIEFEGEVTN